MTYVELIVVLAIFSIMSSIVMFNYRDFQSKVEIKSLSNDIALRIVQAQKDAMSGKLTQNGGNDWKPAYGVYFDKGDSTNKEFIYFADLSNDSFYQSNEELETININKSYYISDLNIVCSGTTALIPVSSLSVTFKRPDSKAVIQSVPDASCTVYYAVINFSSPNSASSFITIYSSGRIQIK